MSSLHFFDFHVGVTVGGVEDDHTILHFTDGAGIPSSSVPFGKADADAQPVEAREILRPLHRTLQARAAHLEVILPGDGVLFIENR